MKALCTDNDWKGTNNRPHPFIQKYPLKVVKNQSSWVLPDWENKSEITQSGGICSLVNKWNDGDI